MTFAELSIHPALRAALAARGYETPTGVQAAVLDAGCAGRDLLVSSQTGSGKTIAFGAAMADALLGAADAPPAPRGPNPIALVIVPTRELAMQVREELLWLFAGTPLRLASCTGGTPVMGDLKALQRGVELVILRVVVLDEADEMLDLGFREDLEKLLQTAPAARRTLLLSATLPSEIRALARRYQRDALAIDPRKADGAGAGAGPGKGAHEDITHRAHLIAHDVGVGARWNVDSDDRRSTRIHRGNRVSVQAAYRGTKAGPEDGIDQHIRVENCPGRFGGEAVFFHCLDRRHWQFREHFRGIATQFRSLRQQ